MKLNLPNKLTVMRIILIPLCMAVIIYPLFPGDVIWRIAAAGIFGATALTDMIDGKIARKYNLITDLGKFLDPLADKLLVIGAMLAIAARFSYDTLFGSIYVWAIFIVVFRETAVTSLRMIASNSTGAVIAAAWLGKVKTVTQMLSIVVLLLEGLLPFGRHFIISYIITAVMVIMTLWSGFDYFRLYLPVLTGQNK